VFNPSIYVRIVHRAKLLSVEIPGSCCQETEKVMYAVYTYMVLANLTHEPNSIVEHGHFGPQLPPSVIIRERQKDEIMVVNCK
jgi:hypothetical protein